MLQTIKAIFPQIGDHIIKQFFLNFFLFSTQSSKMSLNMCKSCHKLRNAKNWLVIRFIWQNEPYFTKKILM